MITSANTHAAGGGSNDCSEESTEVDLPALHQKTLDDSYSPINIQAIALLALWYLFSFGTLFLNKYILTYLYGEPTLLGACQMLSTTLFGFAQMHITCDLCEHEETMQARRQRKRTTSTSSSFISSSFFRNMALVGGMRFSTVVLGLVALKYISVSFTETVKATAPLFTVFFARLVLGEKYGFTVLLSLVPVMGGLVLCTAYELDFNTIGFAAALATNLMDCLQNVFSKHLMCSPYAERSYTPAELQFYTSVASVIVQIPAAFLVMDVDRALRDLSDHHMLLALLLDGAVFHAQSITAYALMGLISPVTHSVANTAKRALLIWLSVLVFGNHVSALSATGTAIVLLGVLCYNRARIFEVSKHNAMKAAGERFIV